MLGSFLEPVDDDVTGLGNGVAGEPREQHRVDDLRCFLLHQVGHVREEPQCEIGDVLVRPVGRLLRERRERALPSPGGWKVPKFLLDLPPSGKVYG